jgi:acetylornithine deacetylase/succinyl-diaminopimelate desuccinylase-like protein
MYEGSGRNRALLLCVVPKCLMPSEVTSSQSWKEILAANQQLAIDEFVELLRIPSISTSEANVQDVKDAAVWVAERMKRAGLENVELFPTGPHECVYGDWLHAPGKPTVLIYGHFDVQPPDPLDLWDSPPFDPVIKDGRIYARGATDMKGNLLLTIFAAEAILNASGSLPVNLKFLFEGQEEIGSRDLGPFISSNKEKLACDLVLTPDSIQWAEDQAVMFLGTKGMCGLQIDLETASMDLHSGLYGGGVPNALHMLVALLGTLRDDAGNILVEGFYDQVVPLSADDREKIAKVPFHGDAYKKTIGIDVLVGEPGYSTHERTWARPTLDLNGVWGGYQGDGVKTVIPAKAHAKITCRLVPDQEPESVLSLLEAHLKSHCPAGARMTITRHAATARAYQVPIDDPGVAAVAEVLEGEYGKPPYYARIGGSLPITDMFLQELGAYTVMVGFGVDDERAHSPNEFFRLADYARGQIVYGSLLERLGRP